MSQDYWSNGLTTPDPLGVQIGAREIYDKVTEVARQVTEMRGELRGDITRLTDQHDGLRADITDLETRMRIQERDSASRDDVRTVRDELREEMSATKARTVQIVGAIVAGAGLVAGIVMPIITK